MVLPILAAAAGIGSALIGANSASKAAGAQAAASGKQLKLQERMFDETNALQEGLYEDQTGLLEDLYGRSQEANRGARTEADAIRSSAYGGNMRSVEGLYDRTSNALRDGYDANMAQAGMAQRYNLGYIQDARNRSIAGFQPYQQAGTNALAAYSSNLGLGEAPEGYSLDLSPAARFFMEEGRGIVEGGAAGSGGLYSGATVEALEKMRQGYASADRDKQMAQLFGLIGQGQNAAGSVANIRTGAADAMAGQRNLTTDLRTRIQDAFTGNMTGADTARTNAGIGLRSDNAAGATGASNAFYAGQMGLNSEYGANMGNARTNRANLYGTAAANYTTGASNALANLGDARAAGAIGVGNALSQGINTGFGTYGYLSSLPPAQTPPTLPQQQTGAMRPMPRPW